MRYKAAFTGFDILRLGGCLVQVPPKDWKVTEQKQNTIPHSTAADAESSIQKELQDMSERARIIINRNL